MPNSIMEILSTDQMPAFGLMPRWNAFISETLLSIDVLPAQSAPLSAQVARKQVGAVGLSWVESTAATISARGGQVGAWAVPMGDCFILTVQETGSCIIEHCAGTIVTRPGDMLLLDPATELPWRVTNLEPMSAVVVKVPADRLIAAASRAEALCGVLLRADNPRFRLASSIIMASKQIIKEHPVEEWEDAYSDILLNAIAVALSDDGEDNLAISRRRLRKEAYAVVGNRLDDPDLHVDVIAAELSTSARTLQRAFLEIGLTPREYILQRRIAVAAEELSRSNNPCSITEIALSSGFNDVSYFARCFRKQTGVSARDYRAGRRRGLYRATRAN